MVFIFTMVQRQETAQGRKLEEKRPYGFLCLWVRWMHMDVCCMRSETGRDGDCGIVWLGWIGCLFWFEDFVSDVGLGYITISFYGLTFGDLLFIAKSLRSQAN